MSLSVTYVQGGYWIAECTMCDWQQTGPRMALLWREWHQHDKTHY